MDRDTKLLFGRLLGEIYRIQRRVEPGMVPVGLGDIYGLINGFEWVVDEVLGSFGTVTERDLDTVAKVFDRLLDNPEELKKLSGYYDIESELSAQGITRDKALMLLRYFHAAGKFTPILPALETSRTPSQLKGLQLDPKDREEKEI